jgi:hypothetical protein
MQKKIFRFNVLSTVEDSGGVWIFLAISICLGFICYQYSISNGILILMVSFFSLASIFGLVIHFNYLKYSWNKNIVVCSDSVEITDTKTKQSTEIKCNEVERIELHRSPRNYRSAPPWSGHEYFCLIDKHYKRIVIPSYIISLKDFRFKILPIRIEEKEFKEVVELFPTIPKNSFI